MYEALPVKQMNAVMRLTILVNPYHINVEISCRNRSTTTRMFKCACDKLSEVR